MTFQKVSATDKPMHGHRKLLLCGFPAEAQSKFETLLKMINLADLPIVWADDAQIDVGLSGLLSQTKDFGKGTSSTLPRAIIVSGITEQELHYLMGACRQTKMKPALWAAITPTSETWTLRQLLDELEAERAAMEKMNQREK